jgi:Protein of unknown function (DUF2958)
MKLMTKALAKRLPALHSQESVADPTVHGKFFDPTGGATWYLLEYDQDDALFTYVTGLGFDELGYTSLAELSSIQGRFGLHMEHDLHFTPCLLSTIRKDSRP